MDDAQFCRKCGEQRPQRPDSPEEPEDLDRSCCARLGRCLGGDKGGASCRSFPFLLAFWVIFIATQWGHREIDIAFELQTVFLESFSGVRTPHVTDARYIVPTDLSNVGPQLTQIRTWGDTMSWLEMTVVPLMWGLDPANTGRVFGSNRVLGGVRIKQFRLEEASCPGPDNLVDFFDRTCYSSESRLDLQNASGADASRQGGAVDSQGARTYWLDISESYDGALAHLSALRTRNWLGEATREAEVQVVLYNGRESVFVLIEGYFAMSVSGAMVPKVSLKTLPAVIYRGPLLLIGDMVLLALLFWLCLGELVVLIQACCKRTLRKDILNNQHLLNWAIIFIGAGFSSFFGYLHQRVGDMSDKIPALLAKDVPGVLSPMQDYPGSAWERRHQDYDVSYDMMSNLADMLRIAELGTFWYCMLIMLKFLQSFDGSPRLAVITETLRTALTDIIHFSIILAFVFVNFSVGAVFLFGHQLKEWSSMQYATNSSFRALMGDFDFMAMSAIAPVSATVWFWLFMTLIYLIMINMFLAIVMDAYMKVKESGRNRPALWDELLTTVAKTQAGRQSAKLFLPTAFSFDDGEREVDSAVAAKLSAESRAVVIQEVADSLVPDKEDNKTEKRRKTSTLTDEVAQEILTELKTLSRRIIDLERSVSPKLPGSVPVLEASPAPLMNGASTPEKPWYPPPNGAIAPVHERAITTWSPNATKATKDSREARDPHPPSTGPRPHSAQFYAEENSIRSFPVTAMDNGNRPLRQAALGNKTWNVEPPQFKR